ncbi:Alpha-1,3-mannosyltransferase-like protein [Lobulomyces angularis]|nr:Alpha-1,3-mannosyltransferase-like protein [Lobulomyces angularis]
MNIAFVHPDLGIGGAERLVVDAAVALKSKNHKVIIYTSHHDKTHCFLETKDEMADVIVVNSRFTCSIFKESFPSIKKIPSILYPGIRFESYDKAVDLNDSSVKKIQTQKQIILSINRFERKKNIELAIESFAELVNRETYSLKQDKLLVITGGHDPRNLENFEYLNELRELSSSLKLKSLTLYPSDTSTTLISDKSINVLFLPSFNENQRTYLLQNAKCLLYTPSGEHFGIVPVEAMYAKVPVIAVNSGGPMETVIDGETGFLCEADKLEFSSRLEKILTNENLRKKFGNNGKSQIDTSATRKKR